MSKRKKAVIGAAALLVVVCAAWFGSIALLNGEWLKSKLEEKVAASLEADLDVERIEFSPFKGRAALVGVRVRRERPDSQFTFELAKGEMQVSVLPLAWRRVDIRRLELRSPRLEVVKHRPAGQKTGGTMDKLKGLVRDKLYQPATAPRRHRAKSIDLRIGELIVSEGTVDCRITRPNSPPFHARAHSVEYRSTDVTISTFYRLLYGADVRCRFDLGESATLDKKGSAKPATFALCDVSLPELDRLLDPTDALAVTSGTMDVNYTCGDGDRIAVAVTVKDLHLAHNAEAATNEFMFIPVQHLIEYLEKRGQRLELAFTLQGFDADFSEDVEYLAREFWDGLLAAIIKELSAAQTKGDVIQRGKKQTRRLAAPQG